MSKLTLLGLEEERNELLESLMEFGAVEIRTVDEKDYDEIAHQPVIIDELQDIDANISKISAALESLDKYCPEKKGFFSCRRQIDAGEYKKVLEKKKQIWKAVDSITQLEENIAALKSEENKLNNTYMSLLQWRELSVPLQSAGTGKTLFQIGTIPSAIDLKQIEAELQEKVSYSIIGHVNSDRDMHYVYLLCHKEMEQECFAYLKAHGYSRVMFAGLEGTAAENIERINDRIKKLEVERNASIEKIKELKAGRNDIEILHDTLCMERDRTKAIGKTIGTRRAFLINGWIPEKASQGAKQWLESKYTVSIDLQEPSEDEEFPVLLENRGMAEAAEMVTSMYSLPNCREIDPNTIMAPFFVLFFGLMLSDGGYGIIMTLAAAFILWKFKLEAGNKKFMKLMLYCGISTIFWGAMFGGWFGIEYFVKYAAWLNMTENPELMLSWSLLFGIIHMFVGIGVKAANLIRKKKYLDALFDAGFYYITFAGFALFLLPYAPKVDAVKAAPLVNIGKYMLIIGIILLILTQGRSKKNFFGKVLGGVASLYDLVSFLSDVLSYSRLLALGLATGIIATIVNQMAFMFDVPIVQIILAIAVLAVGHSVNFSINALGAYVHSCRLQFLEFFGKFYTGGGEAFDPLKANTKYITIKPSADI